MHASKQELGMESIQIFMDVRECPRVANASARKFASRNTWSKEILVHQLVNATMSLIRVLIR